MVSSARPLRFYFDFISPFAYLGWTQIHALGARSGRTIEPTPILFAACLDRWGHRGPAEIAPKRQYTWKYAARLAHDLGVPIRPPPAHPFNPLLALRLATIPENAEAQRAVIDKLFERAWVTGEGVTDPDAVVRALDAIGQPGRWLVEQANAADTKSRLKAETSKAIEAGVFGVPTVDADGELFWGQDSFPHVERFLRGEDPLGAEVLAAWARLPVGVQRKM